MNVKALGVIPARFASTRLMGKPLADICGKPMIQRTYESASSSKLLSEIIIATDDERIENVCKNFGARVILTPVNIATGSDRIAYAAKEYPGFEIIANIQGDEPFIGGEMIDSAIEPLLFDRSVEASTLAKKIETMDELKDPSIPKVVFDLNNYALYFSRSPIPYVREAKNMIERIVKADIYKHIGLYVYRKEALMRFTSLEPSELEKAECLEQLRMLENGFKIKVVVSDKESISIDTPSDLERARKYCEKFIIKQQGE